MKKTMLSILGVTLLATTTSCALFFEEKPVAIGKMGYSIPIVDLDTDADSPMHFIVDKEKGQYLGHPSTYRTDDGTIICVYPKGHGRGAVQMKKSTNGGKTWSERLPTPKSWETSQEVPTLYEMFDKEGKKRIVMFSGRPYNNKDGYNRYAYSDDDGKTWSEFIDIKNQMAGIVVMSDLIPLNTGKGHYMASYHTGDWGKDSEGSYGTLRQMVTFTEDAGRTWSDPVTVFPGTRRLHLCEGGFVRSPDGKEIALLLRENTRNNNSQVMFSRDEGKTWTAPRPLPGALCGDRHQAIYLPDGRLFIQFRDLSASKNPENKSSPTEGDWVAWVGTYDDIQKGYEGEFRVRMKDNKNGWDTTYPCAELLEDGTIVCTTYGHWDIGHSPYIRTIRLPYKLLDQRVKEIRKNGQPKIINNMGKGDVVFDPNDPESIHKLIEDQKKKK